MATEMEWGERRSPLPPPPLPSVSWEERYRRIQGAVCRSAEYAPSRLYTRASIPVSAGCLVDHLATKETSM